jgi:hypothetical protein
MGLVRTQLGGWDKTAEHDYNECYLGCCCWLHRAT